MGKSLQARLRRWCRSRVFQPALTADRSVGDARVRTARVDVVSGPTSTMVSESGFQPALTAGRSVGDARVRTARVDVVHVAGRRARSLHAVEALRAARVLSQPHPQSFRKYVVLSGHAKLIKEHSSGLKPAYSRWRVSLAGSQMQAISVQATKPPSVQMQAECAVKSPGPGAVRCFARRIQMGGGVCDEAAVRAPSGRRPR